MHLLDQNTEKIATVQKINWLGLDFTSAKMIGSHGFTDPHRICNQHIHHQWNELLIREYDKKYNIGAALGNKEVYINFDIVRERNARITSNQLVINHDYHIEESKIKEIINGFPVLDNGAVNVVFIVEAFNKNNLEGKIWVVFFESENDINNIVMAKKMTGKPRGFGLRNYWAYCVYEVIKNINHEYDYWK